MRERATPEPAAFSAEVRTLARALAGDQEALSRAGRLDPGGELAARHRIGPILALACRRIGLEAPEPWAAALRRSGALHMILADSLERISRALGDAGVPWAPLKGMDLCGRLYRLREERPSGDLDVLVAPEHLAAARAALAQAGWQGEHDSPRVEDFLDREGYNWKATGPNGLLLELHFRLWGSVPEAMAGEMLARSRPAPELGATARRLGWADAFALTAAHTWVTPPPRPLLYWWELELLAQAGGEGVTERVVRRTRGWGLELTVGLAALGAAGLFAGRRCERIARALSAELRRPERRVLALASRVSPEEMPLARLALARLLAGRASRMGWRAPLRRLWAHPGVVEQHTPEAWPWPWRRIFYLLLAWRPGPAQKLFERLERRYSR